MQKVVISKSELLKISKENYEKYKELYSVTLEAYNELLEEKKKELDKFLRKNISKLEKKFKESKDNQEHIESYFSVEGFDEWSDFLNTKPLDHRKTFEESIEMIEIDSRENIELSKDEYQKIVKNNWTFLREELGKARLMRMSIGEDGVSGRTGPQGSSGSSGPLGESLSTVIKSYES